MKASEVLDKAADLIEKRGWTAGEGWGGCSDPVELCLEGGILAATGMSADLMLRSADGRRAFKECPAYRAVRTHLGLAGSLFAWNDRIGRTASEVIEVLRACAVIEAAREAQEAAWETYAELVTA